MLSVTTRATKTASIHFMEAASKKCWSAAGFCKLLATLSREANIGLTPARTCRDKRKTICPCSGWSRDVGSSIHQPPLMLLQWHGFLVRVCSLSLRFWQEPIPQGRFTTLYGRGVKLPEVLQHLRYCNTWGTATPAYHIYIYIYGVYICIYINILFPIYHIYIIYCLHINVCVYIFV